MKSTRPVPAPHPAWLLLLFLVPVAVWLVVAAFPIVDLQSAPVRRVCRNLGYLAAACLLVTYLYSWRRLSLQRRRGHLSRWMRWHIGSAYLACGLTVIHVRGHWPGAWLTSAIVWLLAIVMLSGIVGYFGQKLIYRLMAMAVDREVGRDRLEMERLELFERAKQCVDDSPPLTEVEIHNWRSFCSLLLDEESTLHQKVWNHKRFGRQAKEIVQAAVKADKDQKNQPEQNKDQADNGEFRIGDKHMVVAALNTVLKDSKFCGSKDAGQAAQSDEAPELFEQPAGELSQRQIKYRNRLLLEGMCGPLVAENKQSVERFFDESVAPYLRSPFPSWGWLFTGAALQPVPRNHYLRVKTLVAAGQTETIERLWNLVGLRHQTDREYWLHRLATAWLWLHTPAAALLFALVLAHILSSIWYGGLF